MLIIGAGPAGTSAAYDLVSAGYRVLLLDKKAFPRKKACAGGVTPKAMNLFRFDISGVVRSTCRSVRITPGGQAPFSIARPEPLCYMTRRQDLDLLALEKAVEKGACFETVRTVTSISRRPSHVAVRTEAGLIQARFLIGADGANSRVRRLAGIPFRMKKCPALEADVRLDHPDRYPMEFDFSRMPGGYYWIFPKDDHVNIGIFAVEPGTGLKRSLLETYARERLGTCGLEAVKGYPIGVGGYAYVPGPDRILLAGDAAGMAEGLLGEGIYFAVKTGQLAARAILSSDGAGIPAGKIYHRSLRGIRTDLKLHQFSARCLYRFPDPALGLLARSFIHGRFARGYAAGKTVSQILLGR